MYEQTTLTTLTPTSFWGMGFQRLGMQILTDHLQWAMKAMTTTAGTLKTEQRWIEASLFIRGTSLDLFLENFGLDYDADALRQGFTQIWKLRRSTS